MLFSSAEQNANKEDHTKWGTIIIVSTIISVGTLFLIGISVSYWFRPEMIFSLIYLATFPGFSGGILALAYK
jgi:hypothetical protein